MFMELGQVLDEMLYKLKQWHLGQWYYKFYMYLGLKRYIKIDKFKDEEHFHFVMIQAGWEQLYRWQSERLIQLYYKDDKEKIKKLMDESNKLWEKWRNQDKYN